MKSKAPHQVSIEQVVVQQDRLAAKVHLPHKGVFLISILSHTRELLFKRFVQLNEGHNEIQMPVGKLNKGHYFFNLWKGTDQVTLTFHC